MSEVHDPEFYDTVYDELGRAHTRLKQQISKTEENDSGFVCFDTSHGHCGLCGSISCNGKCFK
jgi:hypothetical protein